MLHELRIENLLLIERAELRLGDGLNVITGETGAGKTILAHSLDLLMGGKARAHIVRPGAEEAWVEGVFDLPPGLLDDPELEALTDRLPPEADEVVLGRRVSASGRTSAFVAGRSATAGDLRALGSRLLSFYGQHEHRKLTLSGAQLDFLDSFIGVEHLALREDYGRAHSEHRKISAELTSLLERDGARERDLDLLRYELSEIEEAAPEHGEKEALAQDRGRLRHAEGLREAGANALTSLLGGEEDSGSLAAGARGALAEAEMALQASSGIDSSLDEQASRLSGLLAEVSDVAAELRARLDSFESDPGRLAGVEERLDTIDRLERKHGGSITSVLVHAESCRAEIARLEGAEELGAELATALSAADAKRAGLAETLTAARLKAAPKLGAAVAKELDSLAMPGATLEVDLLPHPGGFGPQGAETVELRIATNPGIEPAPLRDAASGGELSRVMLALSGVTAVSSAATLVFDEVDAGVGGNTARRVGEKLRALGSAGQVLCITHLPQIASAASTHFRIEKSTKAGTALASVEKVEGEELVAEIRRMLGADSGDEAADRHARELLAA